MRSLLKNKLLFLYACLLAGLCLLLKLAEYRLLIIDHRADMYAGAIALLFLLLGVWLSRNLFSPKKELVIIEKEKIIEKEIFIPAAPAFVQNRQAIQETDLSARELEVLQWIAKGLSNQEIATTLFVSVNTVKTHVTNLFYKLEVSRRTQAVEKAKQLSIIP